MRKRNFVCGIALCLALSVAGCGKNSEEQQAVNYYQNELGLDKEEAEELAHELYGEDEEEESSAAEIPEETVVEPLPELVNSEWYEQKVQIYDMVFTDDMYLTEEDIRKIVEGSAYDVELMEDFDENGEVCPSRLMINGETVAQIWKARRGYRYDSPNDLFNYGLIDDGYYYWIGYGSAYMESNWYDKASIEFENLKTRDDVLAYLAENSFAEVDKEQATYAEYERNNYTEIFPDKRPVEFADIPHYYCQGAQSITLFRIHGLSETDQVIERHGLYYQPHFAGAQLNLVNCVTFTFNIDGTIASMDWVDNQFMVMGEQID